MNIQLTDINKDNIFFVKDLYFSSFQENERRLWQNIQENNKKQGMFRFFVIEDCNNLLGFVSVWNFKEFIYLEYLATYPAYRNNGIGAEVLQLLKQKYSKPIVLEVELPIDSLTERRIKFYQRNGFSLLDDFYMQPPYSKDLAPVEMKIMTTDTQIAFSTIKTTLYNNVYC